jgi:D-tyrosyl-tRNA(Tyr) deacylase
VRVVLQRVSRAEVRIGGLVAGRIGRGYLLLVGFGRVEEPGALEWMADRILSLRLFPDESGRMNRDLEAVGGGLLVVSQFTLYADARKGRRPGFTDAAEPAVAIPHYERFLELLRARSAGPVETGEFGALMDIELINDGPVTLWLER